jgi:glycosyltransferase involved in cell wall biosynthesis
MDPTLDVCVFFTPMIPLLYKSKRSIVIAYDLSYLNIATTSFRKLISRFILRALQAHAFAKADTIVTVSRATGEDLLRHFNIESDKIQTIYIDAMPFPNKSEPLVVPEKFYLFAGVLKERKNVKNIIRAYARDAVYGGVKLVIAGEQKGAYYDSLLTLINQLEIGTSVIFVGYVSNSQLRYLYEHAIAFVFPSLLEGFGMPILEAMRLGTPVITSNLGALAEIAGDAAVLVNPHDVEDIALALTRVRDSVGLQRSLRERGIARAGMFSWENTAKALLSVLENGQ